MASEGSKIFVGHRALGYVSNHVPLVTRYIHRRREHLVRPSYGLHSSRETNDTVFCFRFVGRDLRGKGVPHLRVCQVGSPVRQQDPSGGHHVHDSR